MHMLKWKLDRECISCKTVLMKLVPDHSTITFRDQIGDGVTEGSVTFGSWFRKMCPFTYFERYPILSVFVILCIIMQFDTMKFSIFTQKGKFLLKYGNFSKFRHLRGKKCDTLAIFPIYNHFFLFFRDGKYVTFGPNSLPPPFEGSPPPIPSLVTFLCENNTNFNVKYRLS